MKFAAQKARLALNLIFLFGKKSLVVPSVCALEFVRLEKWSALCRCVFEKRLNFAAAVAFNLGFAFLFRRQIGFSKFSENKIFENFEK
ncbi:MAG: hypothetical protein J1E59_02905 [Treponema sp.]|nr:hypothetical protein [Treponema sp.]